MWSVSRVESRSVPTALGLGCTPCADPRRTPQSVALHPGPLCSLALADLLPPLLPSPSRPDSAPCPGHCRGRHTEWNAPNAPGDSPRGRPGGAPPAIIPPLPGRSQPVPHTNSWLACTDFVSHLSPLVVHSLTMRFYVCANVRWFPLTDGLPAVAMDPPWNL